MFDFLKEAIQSPKTIGAIAPSSPRLAQMMAQRAVADHPDVIIEVGAGDGAITQALLRARHPETTYRYAGPAHLSVQAAPNLLRRLIENLVRNATLHGTGDLSFEVLQESGHLTFRCSNAINAASTDGTGNPFRHVRHVTVQWWIRHRSVDHRTNRCPAQRDDATNVGTKPVYRLGCLAGCL